jgi:hypothetical protein
MLDKELTIKYKRTEDGLAIEIHGTPGVNWAKFVKRSHDSIIKSLEEQYNKEDDTDEAEVKEEAIKSLADLAEKSVEEIKKEIKEADPENEKSGFAQVSLKYISKAAKDLFEKTAKEGKKNE